MHQHRELIVSIFIFVLTAILAVPANADQCSIRESYVTLQLEITFAFEDEDFNSASYHQGLGFDLKSRSEKKQIYLDMKYRDFDSDILLSMFRYCLMVPVDSIARSKDQNRPFDEFLFTYGPRSKRVSIPEVSLALSKLISGTEPPEMVFKIETVLELRDENPPDWMTPISAIVVEHPDLTKSVRIEFYNASKKTVRNTSINLIASNTFVYCMSTPNIVSGVISISAISGDSVIADATDLVFGDVVRRKVDIERGPCGELDVAFKLGELPPIEPGESLFVNYKLEAELAGMPVDFWSNFKYLIIEASGSRVFPKQLRVSG